MSEDDPDNIYFISGWSLIFITISYCSHALIIPSYVSRLGYILSFIPWSAEGKRVNTVLRVIVGLFTRLAYLFISIINARLLKTIATLDERITPGKIKYFSYLVVILYLVLNSLDIYAGLVLAATNANALSPQLTKIEIILIGIWGGFVLIYDFLQQVYTAFLFFHFNKRKNQEIVQQKYKEVLKLISVTLILDFMILMLYIMVIMQQPGLIQENLTVYGTLITMIHCAIMVPIFFEQRELAFIGSAKASVFKLKEGKLKAPSHRSGKQKEKEKVETVQVDRATSRSQVTKDKEKLLAVDKKTADFKPIDGNSIAELETKMGVDTVQM